MGGGEGVAVRTEGRQAPQREQVVWGFVGHGGTQGFSEQNEQSDGVLNRGATWSDLCFQKINHSGCHLENGLGGTEQKPLPPHHPPFLCVRGCPAWCAPRGGAMCSGSPARVQGLGAPERLRKVHV